MKQADISRDAIKSKKRCWVYLLFICAVTLCGWGVIEETIETGPYKFVYPANFGNRINVPADIPTTKQGVYLGRLLFYETRLSSSNKISCGSCHQQDKAFTDGKDFSIGVDGLPGSRNSMSLVNLLWTRKFFWDGRSASLEHQLDFPLSDPHEMNQSLVVSADKLKRDSKYPRLFNLVYGDGSITPDRIKNAISQFERSLISAGSPYDRYLAGIYKLDEQELKGITVFKNCEHCHGGVKSYKEVFHNNGLDSVYADKGIGATSGLAIDMGRFKAPTLRNIAVTAPYMHDGRFKTLNEVIDHYSDHIIETPALSAFIQGRSGSGEGKSLKFSAEEKKTLIAFLNMLTDTAFLQNPAFSDPNVLNVKNQ